ncbi:TetR/AcrR family transcriptional regulator [Actinoallomurus rhizosphaericola]|uniref:TetR/AcrR family transcriptional regulator n=1 Tax=Actinoallomurus rhizosphaericola TaxID=2952536 RepID=UPI0020912E69|nr:TetR/AcrR family transcriptional regulator [Actinoallomurus rhizosphaericola]MCO5994195.1 TetR/AcrR family transcriptional regulator [Actinoallomurus rhizosphaericola]
MRDGTSGLGHPREPHPDDAAGRRARSADAEAAAARRAGLTDAGDTAAGRAPSAEPAEPAESAQTAESTQTATSVWAATPAETATSAQTGESAQTAQTAQTTESDDAAARRARLMDALVTVVAERGYPRTTVEEVAARAGLPADAFHACFGGIEECFLAAYERGTRLLLARTEAAYRAESSWPAAVRAGLRAALELAAAEPAFARMCVIDASMAGARAHRARVAFLARFRSFLGGPGIPRIPDEIRNAIIGGVYTMVYNHVECDRTAELPELADPLTDFLLAFYREGGSPASNSAAASSRPRGSSAK